MISTAMVLDLIAAALVVVAVIVGIKRGFIKSIIGLVGLIAAAVLAAMFASPLASTVYDSVIEKPLSAAVENAVETSAQSVASTVGEQIENATAGLPDILQAMLAADVSWEDNAAAAVDAAALSETLTGLLKPICISVVQVLMFLLLFIVILIAIKMLGGVIDKLFSSLPVIKQANGALGGVIGAVQGILLVFVLCFALELYMTLTGADAMITREQLSQTVIVKHFMAFNPFFA